MLGRKSPERLSEREKVAQRREEVLSRGRKFKYPLQYAKHRVAIIASIISVVAVAALVGLGAAALYLWGDTGDVTYRITEVLPVPVAEIAGAKVRFSDYLLFYRSSVAVLDQSAEDFDRATYQRAALSSAEEYTYAEKLAQEHGITVTSEEVAKLFDQHRQVGGIERSEQSFLKVLSENFGLDKDDYNRMLYLLLIKMKVAAAVDTKVDELSGAITVALQETGGNFSAVAERFGDAVIYEDTGGLIPVDNVDGGRADVALTLSDGAWSDRFISSSGDAYYFVKLLSRSDTGHEVSYASLRIPFTVFAEKFQTAAESDELQEYIKITSLQNDEN